MFEKLLSKRGLSFDRLRAIVALDEAGSLVKAAAGDPNRQSQYSRQLSELEDFFRLTLTRRAGRNLTLTEAGKRLADIARESFVTLEHFSDAYNDTPIRVKVGAGDSLLQWLLFPKLPSLKIPKSQFLFRNMRTKEINDCLCDLTLDLGLLRETGISPNLKSVRVHRLTYCIFVPRTLLPENRKADYRWILENLPLAFQGGDGQFQKNTVKGLEKDGIKLNFQVGCESFPEICRIVQTGLYAAILPAIAERDLQKPDFLRIDASVLKAQERTICLAWNPRIQRVRPGFDRLITRFKETLAGA